MFRRFWFVIPLFALGCGNGSGGVYSGDGHDHNHDRDKMLLADVGPLHAALTAHLSSKTGNELDIFFEKVDKDHTPAPLPLKGFTATAKLADGGEQVLEFHEAEKEERKDDPDGQCSHFVATAAWMNPGDTFTVTATVEINGKKERMEWKAFNPKKYAHFEE